MVNTGDDVTMHGLRICPDLDTVIYTLGGGIDEERGWGRAGETWTVKDELAAYGAEPDLVRPRRPRPRHPPGPHPDARRRLPALGRSPRRSPPAGSPASRVLPMSDQRVETHVVVTDPETGRQQAIHFQEWWVRHRAALDAAGVRPGRASTTARPAPGVVEAFAAADVVLLAPSNPVVSVGTILGVPGPARGAAGHARPRSSGSPRSSAARSCAAWPTAACPCSASRSARRASAGTTAPARPAACSTPGWSHRTTPPTSPASTSGRSRC